MSRNRYFTNVEYKINLIEEQTDGSKWSARHYLADVMIVELENYNLHCCLISINLFLILFNITYLFF